MKYFYCLFFLIILFSSAAFAQEDTLPKKPAVDTIIKDTVPVKQDTMPVKKDTVRRRDTVPKKDSTRIRPDSAIIRPDSIIIMDSLQAPVTIPDTINIKPQVAAIEKTEKKDAPRKIFEGKELLFYYLVLLLLLFGLIRQAFPKYFYDLLQVFFRSTMKQKQLREQLLQSVIPSILLNGYFALSAGLYISFLLDHFNFPVDDNFWLQYLYCVLGLTCIYLGKFIALKITGWLFNVKEAAESYIFIVFIVNKMLGIFLIPFLILLAFTGEDIYQVTLVLSWIGVGLLYSYRFFLTYTAVRNHVKLNPFHFILYLFAFEVIPLLLIYKMLLMIF